MARDQPIPIFISVELAVQKPRHGAHLLPLVVMVLAISICDQRLLMAQGEAGGRPEEQQAEPAESDEREDPESVADETAVVPEGESLDEASAENTATDPASEATEAEEDPAANSQSDGEQPEAAAEEAPLDPRRPSETASESEAQQEPPIEEEAISVTTESESPPDQTDSESEPEPETTTATTDDTTESVPEPEQNETEDDAEPQNQVADIDCAGYIAMASSGVTSEERRFALTALGSCPKAEAISRLLEHAIRSDDRYARRAAWASLGNHLDASSFLFLTQLYFERQVQVEEEEGLYIYLARSLPGALIVNASENAEDDELRERIEPALLAAHRIWTRGLAHSRKEIQANSLIALGRLGKTEDQERLVGWFKTEDNELLLAALRAARDQGAPNARPYAIQLLRHESEAIQREAVRYLAKLGDADSIEALMVLDLEVHPLKHRAEVKRAVRAYLEREETPDIAAYTLRRVALHSEPTERSPASATVRERSIVYVSEHTGNEYALPEGRDRAPSRSPWYRVQTASGLTGWVHGGSVVLYRP